ncbi:MAG: thiolase family protein, partial [bacterium]|nr:thiolase family protein [bacterium]
DAEINWPAVESAFVGTSFLGMAPGHAMLKYLGATGLAISQVENASASGSSAFRQACIDVASGISDVSLAVGIDKVEPLNLAPPKAGIRYLTDFGILPMNAFALMTSEYMHNYGVSDRQIAKIAVKNHNNGANNPFAQFQKPRTLEEVMQAPKIAGSLTRFHCCPLGDGAAAVIVASEKAIKDLSVGFSRAIRVAASVSQSEKIIDANQTASGEITRITAEEAYRHAEIGPDQLDIVELHDAFAVEELVYTEAMGLCKQGEGAKLLESGKTHIGGSCAVSPSGGLLAMGHPCGPTGIGQIVEITNQLRGEAGPRQQPDAVYGLAHMVGIGYVCVIHILAKNAGK